MKPQYIANFEKLGFGIFCHFGLYSSYGKGEWLYAQLNEEQKKKYFEEAPSRFKVRKDWAKKLVKVAKDAGAKYICLTTRHHEGFSLYDACGLNDFDAPHSPTGRDLIKEFVDACNEKGIVPFFYHTLLDWHHPDYETNFDSYIDYLNKSVEILCTRYGKIGGLWFDGFWNKPTANWQFDRLYALIRKYQPEAMIINNTGLSKLGEVGHYEIDAATFERGKPAFLSSKDGKERSGEVCDAMTDHWGFCADDIKFKSVPQILDLLIDSRRFNANLLFNIGPKGDGSVQPIEAATLASVGKWIKMNKNFIYNVHSAEIDADNAYIVKDDKYYYAIIPGVPMSADANVARGESMKVITIHSNKKIKNARYLDNGGALNMVDKNSFKVTPFLYGTSMYARVVRFKL